MTYDQAEAVVVSEALRAVTETAMKLVDKASREHPELSISFDPFPVGGRGRFSVAVIVRSWRHQDRPDCIESAFLQPGWPRSYHEAEVNEAVARALATLDSPRPY